jgi:glutamate-1-semialdehyde 2,1-aminomutase
LFSRSKSINYDPASAYMVNRDMANETVSTDSSLQLRARAVIPGGMYGHQHVGLQWPGAPQFFSRGNGPYIWDSNGRRYIDLMCSYGPILHGHRHPAVEAAVRHQLEQADCQNCPSPVMIDLAERLISIVKHADWAMFMKNGSDATTLALTIARAATGHRKILVAEGAYHGAAPWCTPSMHGIVPEERANLLYYRFNDIPSVEAALEKAADDLAAIIVSPFRHDAGEDQELVNVSFAKFLRSTCDRLRAALILDDVRCGFRLAFGGSWEPIGVAPDLSAWSKAIANGYPIAALLGSDKFRQAASDVFATGSFWFSAAPMAASMSTLNLLEQEQGVERMGHIGGMICSGLKSQALSLGLEVNVTGHVTMPYLKFAHDDNWRWTSMFASECAQRGLYVHPRHNWFLSTAITEVLAEEILATTERAFSAVRAAGVR